MGILRFFGTLRQSNITAAAIEANITDAQLIQHLLLDFNAMIHVTNVSVLAEINKFMRLVLEKASTDGNFNTPTLQKAFDHYKMPNRFQSTMTGEEIVNIFHEFFNDHLLDKLIITQVIKNVKTLLKTFCEPHQLKTLYLAIDGVPSKGKMMEQRHRRYMGEFISAYSRLITRQFRNYLQDLPHYEYEATIKPIKWARAKITPGTQFMNKLCAYLRDDKIIRHFQENQSQVKIILSDMNEYGEGEKKIMNYIDTHLATSRDHIVVSSPDADVILLCMLLKPINCHVLRHDDRTSREKGHNVYDIIHINELKQSMVKYLNTIKMIDLDKENVGRDVVCISIIFGNDFVPKMESINVQDGFETILNAYFSVLQHYLPLGRYLINQNNNGKFVIHFKFLQDIFQALLPIENDFIRYNALFNRYMNMGDILRIFHPIELNEENIKSILDQYRAQYNALKEAIMKRASLAEFTTDKQFMNILRRALDMRDDKGNKIPTSRLSSQVLMQQLSKYYAQHGNFPRLNIMLRTRDHSSKDYRHRHEIMNNQLNRYQIELYKFDKMLDEYYFKFNAQPLDLSESQIDAYYDHYFGVQRLMRGHQLTTSASQVMHTYMQGLMWVFEYYYNDRSYLNTWYYPYDRAPLLGHIYAHLTKQSDHYLIDLIKELKPFKVTDTSNYFTTVEQLIYVSPLTSTILNLLPEKYAAYLTSDEQSAFMKASYVDISRIARSMFKQDCCTNADCHNVSYFNKCLMHFIRRPTAQDDEAFLKSLRSISK